MNKIVHRLGSDVHKDLRRLGCAQKNVRMHRLQVEGVGANESNDCRVKLGNQKVVELVALRRVGNEWA